MIEPSPEKRHAYIDGIRAMSIISVILFHIGTQDYYRADLLA